MGKHNPPPKGRGDPTQRNNKQQERQTRQQFRKNRQKQTYGDASWKTAWNKFSEQLAALNLTIKDVAGDGNCLFRAIADQIEGDPNNHANFRARIVNYIRQNEEDYAPFIEDDRTLDAYLAEMSRNAVWGGHLEIHAASMLWNVNVCIHQLDQPRWEMRNHDGNVRFIHLSYHDGEHYSSVRRRDEPASHSGAPLPIRLEQGIPWSETHGASSSSSSGTSGKKGGKSSGASGLQEYVANSTGCFNYKFIEEVLNQCGQDPSQAIEFIIACGAATDVEYQRDFLLGAGVDPGDFGDDSAAFEDPYAYSYGSEPSASSSSSGSKPSGTATPDKSKNPHNGQKNKGASDSSSSENASGVHPKLAKWANQHQSNTKRQQKSREQKGATSSSSSSSAAAQQQSQPAASSSSEPAPDLGALRI
eukprot:TRINITY_DN12443_c0_g1_i1.p1 TRINITY_DN12443_c0_g1~~TRINITY_DN12443_c0_g1_i1.p1  ORF type:complete len:417 (+),score=71.20 TRINITY_DN12443_c0_g1_i1:3-1253(+)